MRRAPKSGVRYSPTAVSPLLVVLVAVMLSFVMSGSASASGPGPSPVFYMNHAGDFWRSDRPFNIADGDLLISQQYLESSKVIVEGMTVLNHSFSSYADLGFRYESGVTLAGLLANQTISGMGTGFGVNLWFDIDGGGAFQWAPSTGCPGSAASSSCDRMTTLGGDAYALGPASLPHNGRIEVVLSGSSPFYMQGLCVGQTHTIIDLASGACPGISGSTPVEIWAGLVVSSGDDGAVKSLVLDPATPPPPVGGPVPIPIPGGDQPSPQAALISQNVLIASGVATALGFSYLYAFKPRGAGRTWGIIVTAASGVVFLTALAWPSLF